LCGLERKKSLAKIYLDYFRNLFVGDISHCFQLTGLLVENSIASISVTLLNYVLIKLIYVPKPKLNFLNLLLHLKQVYIAIEGLEKSLGLDQIVQGFLLGVGLWWLLWRFVSAINFGALGREGRRHTY